MSLLDAALAYADRGWHLFPCGQRKLPLIRGGRGLLDATTDPDQITEWWTRWPDALIGCACGPSGIWVLDLDPPEGETVLRDLIRQHGGFRDTLTARTVRGGWHHYWLVPPGKLVRNSAGKIGPNIDVRGAGGYVILPPSASAHGAYEWTDPYVPVVQAPTWLVLAAWEANSATRAEIRMADEIDAGQAKGEVATRGRPVNVQASDISGFTNLGIDRRRVGHPAAEFLARLQQPAPAAWSDEQRRRYVARAVSRELADLEAATEGTRNDRLNRAAFALFSFVKGGWLPHEPASRWLTDAALSIGLGQGETEKTILSAWTAATPRRLPA